MIHSKEHEPPTFAQWPTQRVGAQQPHAGPQGHHESIVFHTTWDPLAPEFFVALATRTLIREVHPGHAQAAITSPKNIDGNQIRIPPTTEIPVIYAKNH